jgi:hypothetical protein
MGLSCPCGKKAGRVGEVLDLPGQVEAAAPDLLSAVRLLQLLLDLGSGARVLAPIKRLDEDLPHILIHDRPGCPNPYAGGPRSRRTL